MTTAAPPDPVRLMNAASPTEFRDWITDRLRGTDRRVPLDVRGGELPHALFASAYPRLTPAARRELRQAVRDGLRGTTDGVVIDGLLLLAAEIMSGPDDGPEAATVRDLLTSALAGWVAGGPAEGRPSWVSRAFQTWVALGGHPDPQTPERVYHEGDDALANAVVAGLSAAGPEAARTWLSACRPTSELVGAVLAQVPTFAHDHGGPAAGRLLSELRQAWSLTGEDADLYAEWAADLAGQSEGPAREA